MDTISPSTPTHSFPTAKIGWTALSVLAVVVAVVLYSMTNGPSAREIGEHLRRSQTAQQEAAALREIQRNFPARSVSLRDPAGKPVALGDPTAMKSASAIVVGLTREEQVEHAMIDTDNLQILLGE